MDPTTKRIAFFVMIGHSFGLVSAVYNYNRRSLMFNSILMKEFLVIANFFYDDKFGFEPGETIESAAKSALFVHAVLGATIDPKKFQCSQDPVILGIEYAEACTRPLDIPDVNWTFQTTLASRTPEHKMASRINWAPGFPKH